MSQPKCFGSRKDSRSVLGHVKKKKKKNTKKKLSMLYKHKHIEASTEQYIHFPLKISWRLNIPVHRKLYLIKTPMLGTTRKG
jgi:hypothetical protein